MTTLFFPTPVETLVLRCARKQGAVVARVLMMLRRARICIATCVPPVFPLVEVGDRPHGKPPTWGTQMSPTHTRLLGGTGPGCGR